MDSWMGWVIMGLCALNLLLLLGLAWVAKIALGPRHLVVDGKMSASDLREWRNAATSPILKGATRTTEDPKKKDQSVILMSDARDERILAADQED